MHGLGKTLVGLGLVLVIIGALILIAGKAGLPPGRLPGDFAYKGKNFSFYFPLGTSILISVALSAFFYLLSQFRR